MHNNEFYEFHSLSNIICVSDLRRMRWTGKMLRMWGESGHMEDLRVDGRTILKWSSKERSGRRGLGSSSS